jgi:hypothetical protein
MRRSLVLRRRLAYVRSRLAYVRRRLRVRCRLRGEAPVGLPVETDVAYCAQPWDSLAAEPGAPAGLRAAPVAGEAPVGLLVKRNVPCCAPSWNSLAAARCNCEAAHSLR